MSIYLGEIKGFGLNNKTVAELFKSSISNYRIPYMFFFYKQYKTYPCKLVYNAYFAYDSINQFLKDKFNHDKKNDIIEYRRSAENNFIYQKSILADLENGIMILLDEGCLLKGLESLVNVKYSIDNFHQVFKEIVFLYIPEKEDTINNMLKFLANIQMEKIHEASINIICNGPTDFYLTEIKIKKPLITDLRINYGDEFIEVHNLITNALKSGETHGLVLLHGLPGSGKTHYIRYLIQEISNKQIVYIPPDMTNFITNPDFFPFMLKHENSILIIEDADNIIKSRDQSGSTTQAVANLLNLSDGLLGDSLHQPIIATFNCELNSIDQGLLRKGRLIAQYEFSKLNVENAQKLSDSLGFSSKITVPMLLADIYNQ